MKYLRSLLFTAAFAFTIAAQTSPAPTPSPTQPPGSSNSSLEKHFISNIIQDQASIWTAPFRVDSHKAKWLLPFAAVTGGLIATDRQTSNWVGRRGGLPIISHDVSWFGKAYTTGGVAAAFYLAGRAFHNEKARETGLLAGEALIDTGIVTEGLKLVSRRARPNAGNERAEFFEGGSSFPSGHSSTVWAVATVIAYEYHKNPFIKYGAYAAATAVSMSRFSGRNHFLSDIVIGSAIGFGVGRFVYRNHHDPNVDLPQPRKVTWSKPQFIPFYDRGTIGASLVWKL
jgi:membrane-associated phospholipid phosphatase